jgi:glycosyltransferase involved in cell wall biosynthesis
MSDNKICVYAICKNESKFVERWYNSMKEADCIVVLDTGSTDDTVEQLKKVGVNKVEIKPINPWRFDVARNESLKLVPEGYNILVCTDLDETFEEGWADKVRNAWNDSLERIEYKYSWSHYDNGNPNQSFMYNKIHSRNWIWKFPVHECLVRASNGSENYSAEESFNLFEYE